MKCYICHGHLHSMGVVPFDKSCKEGIPIVDDTPMKYYKCDQCQFICCPEMLEWSNEEFAQRIYNEDYVKYDPDYVEDRPAAISSILHGIFAKGYKRISHLDYGGGDGTLSYKLNDLGWKSNYYDPYTSKVVPTGTYNLVTAIEVFEHSKNMHITMEHVKSYMDPNNGAVIFTTLLADKDTTLDWWYISPRNGHIGILSEISIKALATMHNLFYKPTQEKGLHTLEPRYNRNAINTLIRGGN